MSTIVITGAASGIGRTTAELLRERGHSVIGADLRGSDVDADLATPEGRDRLVSEVSARTDGRIDAVVACAGLATPTPATVRVNFYGAVATLEGLRPLLAGSEAPRAAVIASMASLFEPDPELLDLLLEGSEEDAVARAAVLAQDDQRSGQIYGTTKRALARWVRRHAPTAEWAGASIPLNAVAPGVIDTPMTASFLASEESRRAVLEQVPMPLNGVAQPIVVAHLLAWLVSAENTHLCGQVVFVDGGSDAVIRGDSTW